MVVLGPEHAAEIAGAGFSRKDVKQYLFQHALSIIVVHNHPTGDPTPSSEDVSITVHLIQAGKLLRIKLLDHLVIGGNGRYVSFRESRLLRFNWNGSWQKGGYYPSLRPRKKALSKG